jgi:hypothetical protein
MQAVGQPIGGGGGEVAIHCAGHGPQGDLPPQEPGAAKGEDKKADKDQDDALQGEDLPE